MKKLLLTTVALVALGAPALAADMAERPRYAKEPPPHRVRTGSAKKLMLFIPAGSPCYQVTASKTFDRPAMLLSLSPHMHLRGKSAEFTLVLPDGRRTWPDISALWAALPEVEQIQLIQRSQDHVEVFYAREQPLSAAAEHAGGQRIHQALGYPFRLTFTRQDAIARQPNGKYETFFVDVPGPTGAPNWSSALAPNACLEPSRTVAVPGVTVIVVRTGV